MSQLTLAREHGVKSHFLRRYFDGLCKAISRMHQEWTKFDSLMTREELWSGL